MGYAINLSFIKVPAPASRATPESAIKIKLTIKTRRLRLAHRYCGDAKAVLQQSPGVRRYSPTCTAARKSNGC
jgi:hypothetical protein